MKSSSIIPICRGTNLAPAGRFENRSRKILDARFNNESLTAARINRDGIVAYFDRRGEDEILIASTANLAVLSLRSLVEDGRATDA